MSFLLLLLLSLVTGCVARSEVKGCLQGWVEFTCTYPKLNEKYQHINLVSPRGTSRTSLSDNWRNVWETRDRVSLYHDIKSKQLKVAIKPLQRDDSGTYRCNFYKGQNPVHGPEQQLLISDGCDRPFLQTAYKDAKTTITCDYPGDKHKFSVKFFCKGNNTCENILSTNSHPKSKGRFTLKETNNGFNISISNVSSDDAGVYWCGVKPHEGRYRASIRQIQLKVEATIRSFKRSPAVGENLTYFCIFPNGAPQTKFICKGEDPSICQRLVTTTQPDNTGKFSMTDKNESRRDKRINFTITVREVTAADTGTYWCGAESTDKTRSNPVYHQFFMTVEPKPTPTFPVSANGVPVTVISVTVCVSVLLLLFALILILLYKRFSHTRNTRNGAMAQQTREDYIYEEIQDSAQKLRSGDAVNTIYATANVPKYSSASLHYSTIKFQNSSDKADGESLTLKSKAACEYSTVKLADGPIYSTVDEPSRSSGDHIYSTVNKPTWQ